MSVDWMDKYMTGNAFRFTELINDDFFQPFRLMYQAGYYVSSIKLMLVAIDSIGYIEFGESKSGEDTPFVKWLNKYADLTSTNLTPRELWEHRNSLLHMSNLNSRQVQKGSIKRLIAYVGSMPHEVKLQEGNAKYYDYRALIHEFGQACNRWIQSYDDDPSKYKLFIARYDLIVSDSRMLHIPLPS
ncbi:MULTISPECIES: hypothetical protein [unclassified Shewanella]|uniref:hypothetical protein n=1 Tax=unclassified Shewanella TaxID=196818 RepID=UPI00156A4ADC|nr:MULTISPECIES: hypothetical protein [unclassified Shewanella]MCU8008487.1 hypothetical protein [Shewanella sp. SM87]